MASHWTDPFTGGESELSEELVGRAMSRARETLKFVKGGGTCSINAPIGEKRVHAFVQQHAKDKHPPMNEITRMILRSIEGKEFTDAQFDYFFHEA